MAFCAAPMLHDFDPRKSIRVETDASGAAISGILSQPSGIPERWHPIAFFSRKLDAAELDDGTPDQELMAVIGWMNYHTT